MKTFLTTVAAVATLTATAAFADAPETSLRPVEHPVTCLIPFYGDDGVTVLYNTISLADECRIDNADWGNMNHLPKDADESEA